MSSSRYAFWTFRRNYYGLFNYDAPSRFRQSCFIIRKDFVDDFKEIFETKLKGKINSVFKFKSLQRDMIFQGKIKPWGFR